MMYYLEGVTRGSFGVEQGELFHFGDLGTWDRASIGEGGSMLPLVVRRTDYGDHRVFG